MSQADRYARRRRRSRFVSLLLLRKKRGAPFSFRSQFGMDY